MIEEITSYCPQHGYHAGRVCITCYATQQERIERESAELRYANTATALRKRIVEELVSSNGHK